MPWIFPLSHYRSTIRETEFDYVLDISFKDFHAKAIHEEVMKKVKSKTSEERFGMEAYIV